ncbi:MAG: putative Diguanylate cyclase/phosphodiesterase [Ilumatobacteraceae bacterium]|nr:putative Diguanylate cyclase/phosphodiesterase [Ilumatobacteraceae bacterium]
MTTDEIAERPESVAHTRHRLGAHGRTAVLSIVLAAGAAALLTRVRLDVGPMDGVRLQWWVIALISVAAEFMVFNIEFRRDVYTFTFSEIPLVVGLLLASPLHLIIGRLVGEAVFLIVKERQPLRKLSLNLSSFFGECVVLLLCYQLLHGVRTMEQPTMWLRALGAVVVADLLGFMVVALAVRWHGGKLQFRSILAIGAFTAPVNTSFALLTGLVLTEQLWGLLLMGGIATFLVITYRSYASLTQRFDSLTQLYDFTRLVSGSQGPDVVLASILGQAKELFNADRAEIWLFDTSDALVGLAVDDEGQTSRHRTSLTAGDVTAWFADSRDAKVIAAGSQPRQPTAIKTALHARNCIVAPITESGDVVGVVAVIDRLGERGYRAQEAPLFSTLANHASVALENGRLIDRLHDQTREREHESLHDALTSLPNRRLFQSRVDEAVAGLATSVDHAAVAVMNLDGFKEINDTLGHACGDAVLVEVAQRLDRMVDASMSVARLGGDEFGLLFSPLHLRSELAAVIQDIRRDLARPITIDGIDINVSASCGVAVAPDDASDGSTLLQRADVAMHDAKAGVGDGIAFYDADMDTNSTRRLTLVNGLNAAIENGELSVVYQPKVNLATTSVVGFEALVRWRHPTLGPIGPDEFIPLAERSGMIHQLTEHVLRTALRQVTEWRLAGHDWSVAVNLSMRNLLDDDIVGIVADALESSGIPPRKLTLEVTETHVMADPARTIAVLEQLSALGPRLSVDDFGTGYSSLAYLQRLPVDEVKIDKFFVLSMAGDDGAEAIVRSVLDLARNLGLHSVAEGVEDRDSFDRLVGLGCAEAQGYFMSRPMPADQTLDAPRILADVLAASEPAEAPAAAPLAAATAH